MRKNGKKEIYKKFHYKLKTIIKFQIINEILIKKINEMTKDLKNEYPEPEIEIFQKFLKEMNLSNKLYKRYLKKLWRYSSDFYKNFFFKRKFIDNIFDLSGDEILRRRKIGKIKNLEK